MHSYLCYTELMSTSTTGADSVEIANLFYKDSDRVCTVGRLLRKTVTQCVPSIDADLGLRFLPSIFSTHG